MSKPLTIKDVANETGLTAALLRAWEVRHGFPTPKRDPSGRRRYEPADVRAVRRVIAERAAGATLPAAIARVRAEAAPETADSFFALLLDDPRASAPVSVARSTMLAVSRAVEDECAARAEPGVLVGAFQERRFYAQSADRWRDLARSSRLAMVFADFGRVRDASGGPAQVPLASRSPLEREWAIVHLAAEKTSVAFVGRERVGSGARGERTFQLVWTLDVDLVRELVEMAAENAGQTAPAVAEALRAELATLPRSAVVDPGFASALTVRVIGYLDR